MKESVETGGETVEYMAGSVELFHTPRLHIFNLTVISLHPATGKVFL